MSNKKSPAANLLQSSISNLIEQENSVKLLETQLKEQRERREVCLENVYQAFAKTPNEELRNINLVSIIFPEKQKQLSAADQNVLSHFNELNNNNQKFLNNKDRMFLNAIGGVSRESAIACFEMVEAINFDEADNKLRKMGY